MYPLWALSEEHEQFRSVVRRLAEDRTSPVGDVNERRRVGKPIGSLQGLQFMIADMAMETDTARQLVHAAAAEGDRGDEDPTVSAAYAQCKTGDVAMRVTVDAVRLLGACGHTKDYPVERCMRDAKITQIHQDTQQIRRVVIAHGLLGRL